MKKLLLNSFIIAGLFMSTNVFNSCAEYTDAPLPTLTDTPELPGIGTLKVKILSGSEAGKTFELSGSGSSFVIGTKRFINNNFMVYQIAGQSNQLQFMCQVINESGIVSGFQGVEIGIHNIAQGYQYISEEDPNGSIKITNIELLQTYDEVGAQIMNGKVTFKGKFEKYKLDFGGQTVETVENNIEIEGTATF